MKKEDNIITLKEFVEAQFKLLSFLNTKLEVFNYITTGYWTNKPVLKNNRFLIYVAHILQKALIIDFAALFDVSDYQKMNFHILYSKKFKDEMNEETFMYLRDKLNKYRPSKDPVKSIVHLRNSEVAHYDPNGSDVDERLSIQLNWNYANEFNELFKVGKDVVQYLGKQWNTSYSFVKPSKIRDLEKMVQVLVKN